MSDIKLNGGEISILKTLGFSGSQMYGKILLERIGEVLPAEFVDTLDSLLTLGYVQSNKVNIRRIEEVETAFFRVNPAHVRDLRDALRPGRKQEQRTRRRRG